MARTSYENASLRQSSVRPSNIQSFGSSLSLSLSPTRLPTALVVTRRMECNYVARTVRPSKQRRAGGGSDAMKYEKQREIITQTSKPKRVAAAMAATIALLARLGNSKLSSRVCGLKAF